MDTTKLLPGLTLTALGGWIGLVLAGSYLAVLGPSAEAVFASDLTFDDVRAGWWAGVLLGVLFTFSTDIDALRRAVRVAIFFAVLGGFAFVQRDWLDAPPQPQVVHTDAPSRLDDALRSRR